MSHFFQERIVDTGRLPLFSLFVSFIVTFVITRINVRIIRAERKWWFSNVKAGDVHIHHAVFGVILIMVGGVAGFALPGGSGGAMVAAAVVFGIGAAWVLDEFALILHLRDVYWTEEGRASVDAVCVAVAVTGLLLLGMRPMQGPQPGDDFSRRVRVGIYIGWLIVNLTLAVITLLKGKIWTGLVGLFLSPLLWIGAIRLARPGSPWARWMYEPGSRKDRRSIRHERRFRRPPIRVKIWVQEFVAGRHDRKPHIRHRDRPDHDRVSPSPRS
jgi:hypothetical protein